MLATHSSTAAPWRVTMYRTWALYQNNINEYLAKSINADPSAPIVAYRNTRWEHGKLKMLWLTKIRWHILGCTRWVLYDAVSFYAYWACKQHELSTFIMSRIGGNCQSIGDCVFLWYSSDGPDPGASVASGSAGRTKPHQFANHRWTHENQEGSLATSLESLLQCFARNTLAKNTKQVNIKQAAPFSNWYIWYFSTRK